MHIFKNKIFLYTCFFLAFFIGETVFIIYNRNLWYKILIVINSFLGCFASSRLGKTTSNGQMGFMIAMGMNPLKNIWKHIFKNSIICLFINTYSLIMCLGLDTKSYEKYFFIFISMILIEIFVSFINYLLAGFLKNIYVDEIIRFFIVLFFIVSFVQDHIFNWFKFGNSPFNYQDRINYSILWGSFIGTMALLTPLFYFYRYSRWNNIKPNFREVSQTV